ncbi:MAG TPA: hypothetical protein VGJ75_06230 [Dongiaceae bacterium]|jgi:hypothetical protein
MRRWCKLALLVMLDPSEVLILAMKGREERPAETGATISGGIALNSTRHGASRDLRRSRFPTPIQEFITSVAKCR